MEKNNQILIIIISSFLFVSISMIIIFFKSTFYPMITNLDYKLQQNMFYKWIFILFVINVMILIIVMFIKNTKKVGERGRRGEGGKRIKGEDVYCNNC